MADDDRGTAADIRVRLNTAIMALRAAKDITPQRMPFREADKRIGHAIEAAVAARTLCQKI